MIVNENIVAKKNGFFERTYSWNQAKLSELGDGYLIQKITRITDVAGDFLIPINIPGDFNHCYYELWNIVDGKPKYVEDHHMQYDDCWSYTVMSFIDSVAAVFQDYSAKFRTAGTISMVGELFFLPSDHINADEILLSFKCKSVKYARDLPSCYECIIESYIKKFYTHKFSHGWDFSDDDAFIDSIKKEFELHKLGYEDQESYLTHCFSNLPIYQEIRDHILGTVNSIHSN